MADQFKLDLILALGGGTIVIGSSIWILMNGISEQFILPHAITNLVAGLSLGIGYFMKE